LSGCLEVNRYTAKIYPPTDEDEIEVYSISSPTRPYVEIAEILGSSKNVYKLKREAYKLGADAIIIVGSNSIKTSFFLASLVPNSVTREKGRKAIAIKYTNQDKVE
jgi:hypothetical protein